MFCLQMGIFHSLLSWTYSGKKASILILGLDGSGKTTLLYRLKTNETNQTIPTIGFNVEEIQYGSLTFTCFDIGGQDKIRRLWHNYYANSDAVIFVVDSNDQQRLTMVKSELYKLMNHPFLKDVPFLIFANKQDLPDAMQVSTLIRTLELHQVRKQWKVCECTATEGLGIDDGFQWLADTI